jgi:hypothetical protein
MTQSMMQINRDRAGRREDLVASGSVVELRYQDGRHALSLRAGKMLHMLVKAANENLDQHVKHRIRLSEFQDIAHFNPSEIRSISDELISTLINVTYNDRITTGSILDFTEINIDGKSGDLIFRFSETMVSVFRSDDRWTILSRKMVLAFESRYSLRLFEILSLRRGLGRKREIFDISDLRSRLGVEIGKLDRYPDFRVKCLDKAVSEVKRVMGMNLSYETIKKGQAVSAIVLSWSDPLTLSASVEKSRLRGSRKAVASSAVPVEMGSVSTGVPPSVTGTGRLAFPAKGSISYGEPWASIARQNGKGWDLDLIASSFRHFCIKNKIPLNAANIETTFTGFCASYAEKRRNVAAI